LKQLLQSFYHKYQKKSFRLTLAVCWLLLSLVSAYQLKNLRVDFNFESFFEEESEDRIFFNQHKQVFGYDNDYLLLIIQASDGLFKPSFLNAVNSWEKQAEAIKGVASIQSPLALKHVVQSAFGITAYPLIHRDDPMRLAADSIRVSNHPLYKQYFSFEKGAMLVAIQHQHFSDKETEEHFYDELQQSLQDANLDSYTLVGRLTAQNAFISNIGNDFVFFTILALLLSALILWGIYRSFRLMLIPYLISVSSLVISLGLIASLEISLSILSILLPTIVLFVSTSDAIHLTNAFRQGKTDSNKHKHLYTAVNKIFAPTLLTSVTTAIGFLSLYLIPSQPIRELGILAAVAIMIAFLVNFIFGPLLLTMRKNGKSWQLPVKAFVCFVLRNRIQIIVTAIFICCIASFGVMQLKSDAYLLKDLPEDDPVRKSFELVDKHFGGSKPWELAVWCTDSDGEIWDSNWLRELNKVHAYIQDSLAYGRILSPIEVIKYAHQVNQGGLTASYQFPTSDKALSSAVKTAQKLNSFINAEAFVDSTNTYARMLAFIPDWGAYVSGEKNRRLETFMKAHVDSTILSYQLTGTTYLIDKSNERVSYNLLKGLLIAALLIAIILMLYFKSFKMLLISLIPNLIPLLLTAGVMGFMEVPIKLTSAIIFVVAFGIAVDDTIHFIGAYQQQNSKGKVWPLIRTMRRTGFSILVTTLVIVAGFSLFTFSNFATTFYLGLFLTLSLVSALIKDLFLLPLLLKRK
jgi:hypothetical protein